MKCRQVFLQIRQVVYLCQFLHGIKGVDKGKFFKVYHKEMIRSYRIPLSWQVEATDDGDEHRFNYKISTELRNKYLLPTEGFHLHNA